MLPSSPVAPRAPSIGAVVLAAGASRRMGTPKALLDLDGAPLLRVHVERLVEAIPGQIRVVLGCRAAQLQAVLAGLPARVQTVENPDWQTTHMADSLRLALSSLPEELLLVTPVDAPPASVLAIRRLCRATPPACLGHAGRAGHPLLAATHHLQRAIAAGSLRELRPHPRVLDCAHDDAVRNLNTPSDWAAWRAAAAQAVAEDGGSEGSGSDATGQGLLRPRGRDRSDRS